MNDPIDRARLRERYWERVPMKNMTKREWEALCDGCGRCCLNKLEDEDTGEVAFTRVACRLLDGETCRCFETTTFSARSSVARTGLVLRTPPATAWSRGYILSSLANVLCRSCASAS